MVLAVVAAALPVVLILYLLAVVDQQPGHAVWFASSLAVAGALWWLLPG